MVLLTCYCQSDSLTFWEIASRVLTVFAAIVAVAYFFRPRLYYCVYKKASDDLIRYRNLQWILQQNRFNYCIKVDNMNLSRNTIKEVKCEVAISTDREFTRMKRIELSKSETLFLKSARQIRGNRLFNYVFWFKEESIPYGYEYLRVRFLATNALGIKKHYERYYRIAQIEENENLKTQCQCWQRNETDKVTFRFIKPDLRCWIGAKFENLFDCRS
jgi:hypothetical protein